MINALSLLVNAKDRELILRALNVLKDTVLAEIKELRFVQMATILQSYTLVQLWPNELFGPITISLNKERTFFIAFTSLPA